jgi:hypothetical protein
VNHTISIEHCGGDLLLRDTHQDTTMWSGVLVARGSNSVAEREKRMKPSHLEKCLVEEVPASSLAFEVLQLSLHVALEVCGGQRVNTAQAPARGIWQ